MPATTSHATRADEREMNISGRDARSSSPERPDRVVTAVLRHPNRKALMDGTAMKGDDRASLMVKPSGKAQAGPYEERRVRMRTTFPFISSSSSSIFQPVAHPNNLSLSSYPWKEPISRTPDSQKPTHSQPPLDPQPNVPQSQQQDAYPQNFPSYSSSPP